MIHDRIGKYLKNGRYWNTRNVSNIKVFSNHHDAIPHGTRTADQVMQQIMTGHVNQGWAGASYHYYIHKDGGIYQMNKHEWVTWIDGVNWDAIGIVMNGYFHPPYNNVPTKEQLASLAWLLNKFSTQHSEFPASHKDTYAHRERSQTACNGDKAYPYIKEYREKLGKVSWGNVVTPGPIPVPPTQNLAKVRELLFYNNAWWNSLYRVKLMRTNFDNTAKLKELLWYDNAWWNSLYRVKEMRKVLPKQ